MSNSTMTTQSQALQNLQSYASKIKRTERNIASDASKAAHEARIDQTTRELENLVEKQKAAIAAVSSTVLFAGPPLRSLSSSR